MELVRKGLDIEQLLVRRLLDGASEALHERGGPY